MKWLWMEFGRPCQAAWVVTLIVLGLVAGPAQGSPSLHSGPGRLSHLQAGAEFESMNGAFTFSDFQFASTGFDESSFSDYLLRPSDGGFLLLLGFGMPFGPNASLEMTYTVTANDLFTIEGASIPQLQLFETGYAPPLADVTWQASNGSKLAGGVGAGDPFDQDSTLFGGQSSLTVNQTVSLSGSSGIVKLENAFEHQGVPEPGTGLLLAAGLGACVVFRRRSAA